MNLRQRGTYFYNFYIHLHVCNSKLFSCLFLVSHLYFPIHASVYRCSYAFSLFAQRPSALFMCSSNITHTPRRLFALQPVFKRSEEAFTHFISWWVCLDVVFALLRKSCYLFFCTYTHSNIRTYHFYCLGNYVYFHYGNASIK